MKVALLLLGLFTQDVPVVSDDDGPQLRLGGEADLHYVHRAGAVEETRNSLNGAPASAADSNFLAGSVSLRLDLSWDPDLTGVLDVGISPFDGGANASFGINPESTLVGINEAWLQMRHVPLDPLVLRLGAQPFRFTNRYDDEPFFLDVANSESAWTGMTATGNVAAADRDVLQPVGARLWYDAALFFKMQVFALTVVEGGKPSLDESVTGFQASAKTGDDLTLKFLTTLFTGPGKDSAVWTIGAAVAHIPHEDWLLAVELYGQVGKSLDGVDKQAYAAQISVRYAGDSWWADAAFECASGHDPDDPDDEGWQSYENVNRFAIVQSAEFGMDWDTNYRLVRASWEYRWRDTTTLRLDAGWFTLPEKVPGTARTEDDRLGTELDVTLEHRLNESTSLHAKGAALFGSEVLEAATADDENDTWLGIIGTALKF